MPVWAWILIGLCAVGLILRLIDPTLGPDATERLGKALAIFFILAIAVGLVLAMVASDGR